MYGYVSGKSCQILVHNKGESIDRVDDVTGFRLIQSHPQLRSPSGIPDGYAEGGRLCLAVELFDLFHCLVRNRYHAAPPVIFVQVLLICRVSVFLREPALTWVNIDEERQLPWKLWKY
jgi:hypothetical protein